MKHKSEICCVFNIGPHYREPIYMAIAKEFQCHFYLGDKVSTQIKTFDYNSLPGFQEKLRYKKIFGNFCWQKGAICLSNKQYRTYIVTGEPYCLSTWLLAILCRLKGKRTVAWTHGWYGKESLLKKIIKKTFFNLFSHILTYNEYSRSLMINEGFKADKLSCIANSLNSYKQKEIRDTLKETDIFSSHFGNDLPVILYCGRIQKVKKLDILLGCIKDLKERGIPCNIVFVGKDVDNVNINKIAKDKGLEKHVWEYGPCYDENKLGEFFYNSSVCVSPGNVGLTAIHSLTYGCPVITHDNFTMQMPEFEAIKDGITGSFFKENDTKDLISKIELWVNKSKEEREKTKKAAFEEIDCKWNIDYQIRTLRIVFETLDNKSKSL